MYVLENDLVFAEITSKAAEVIHFYEKDNQVERLWQADPTYWAGRNPILFPQVGNTSNKSYVTKGKQYSMGNHGLARHAIFEMVEHTQDRLVLTFKDDEKTYEQYPYHFELKVIYTLVGKRLNIEYQISNHDEEVMPFGFGLHPAFACPLKDGEEFSDYKIVFPSIETQTGPASSYLKNQELVLNYEAFEKLSSLIYENVQSPYVDLVGPQYKMRIGTQGYKFLVIWTPNAPFVCIEPWHSHGDFEENQLPFEKREGMINLASNQVYQTAYYFEIL
ncbi:MAG: aldose 1-epimerase family protein [Erysipelotrichaceae bacterium]